jgi:hypothetical protein
MSLQVEDWKEKYDNAIENLLHPSVWKMHWQRSNTDITRIRADLTSTILINKASLAAV